MNSVELNRAVSKQPDCWIFFFFFLFLSLVTQKSKCQYFLMLFGLFYFVFIHSGFIPFQNCWIFVLPLLTLSTPLPFSHWNIEFVFCYRFEWTYWLTFLSIPSVRKIKWGKKERKKNDCVNVPSLRYHCFSQTQYNSNICLNVFQFLPVNTPVACFKTFAFAIYIIPYFNQLWKDAFKIFMCHLQLFKLFMTDLSHILFPL